MIGNRLEMDEDKRVLKQMYKRMPKEFHTSLDIVNDIRDETGFRTEDIRKVIGEYQKSIARGVLLKKSVRIFGLGTIFPAIKRSRVGMNLKGGVGNPTKIIVPNRFGVKFIPNSTLIKDARKLPIFQEELDAMYKD